MRKIFLTWIAMCSLLVSGVLMTGCYDDDDVWKEIENVKGELTELKTQFEQMQGIVNRLAANKGIVSIKDSDEGHVITFTDNSVIVLKDGKDGQNGKDGSQIGVQEDAGIYYWTVNGEFLLVDGKKLAVTGNNGQNGQDGHSPVLSIDAEGFWCVDGERILSDGKTVPAQGDSFFQKVESINGEAVFTLADGSVFKVPMSAGAVLAFEQQGYMVKGSTVLKFKAEKVSFVALDQVPAGIKAVLDEKARTVTLSIEDASAFVSGSRLILKAADQKGYAMLAAASLIVPDLKKADFIVVNEGWFGHEGGSLNAYYNGVWDLRAYQGANPGMTLGTTSTVAVQNGDLIYIVSKDGEHLVEADASSLAHKSKILLTNGQAQHFAAVSATQGYLATTDGLFEVSLNPLVLGKKIMNANAGDICQVDGKIYFISGKKVYFYDPATAAAPVALGAAETGFTRAGEYLYAATKDRLVLIKTSDNTYSQLDLKCRFNMNTWAYTPTCLSSTADGKYVCFASGKDLKRFNTATQETATIWTQPSGRSFYGAGLGISPKTGEAYVISAKGYTDDVNIEIVNVEDGSARQTLKYTSVGNTYWFASQVIFVK